jgi:hypothetical protein
MTSLVIGASSVTQLEANIAALDNLDFADSELAEIDQYATEGDINLGRSSVHGAGELVTQPCGGLAGRRARLPPLATPAARMPRKGGDLGPPLSPRSAGRSLSVPWTSLNAPPIAMPKTP